MRIRRKCTCGCGQITSLGRRYIHGHNRRGEKLSEEHKRKISISEEGKFVSEQSKRKMSLAKQNMSEETKRRMSLAHKGIPLSKEHKLKMIKPHPNDKYCESWRDKEYKDDLRKDHCEDAECKGDYKKLSNHHINLNKKDCRPSNVMTLCNSCHLSLHNKLAYQREADYKEYLTIIRPNRITYIHKETKTKIILNRRNNDAYP